MSVTCNTHDVNETDTGAVPTWHCYTCEAPAQFEEVHVSELNGEEVTFYPEFGEFVCSGCNLNVGPAGHDTYACREAAWDNYSTRD